MSCWTILGVTPGVDQKTIKLAYSKLLKSTRPDDDPEGFAQLHKAYKSALLATPGTKKPPRVSRQAASVTSNTADTKPSSAVGELHDSEEATALVRPPAPDDPATHDTGPPPIVDTVRAPEATDQAPETESIVPATAGTEQDAFLQSAHEQQLQRDRALIETQLHQLIASRRMANRMERWRFIETVSSMVDLNFSTQVSDLVFGAVSAANAESLKKGHLQVKQPVLRYLNNYFQWEKNWRRFEESYGQEQSQAVFRFVNETRANNQSNALPYFARILAFFVDIILGGICWYIGVEQPAASFFVTIGVLYFLVVIPVMEASVWQASIGKRMFGLMVVNKSGLRLTWYHSFLRSYVSYFCLAGIKLVVWINMYTSYKHNALLQDLISGSSVVERG